MLTLPDGILPVLHPFATLFRSPTWLKAQIAGRRDTGPGPTHRGCGATRRTQDDRNYAR